jgi:hypothetical protein
VPQRCPRSSARYQPIPLTSMTYMQTFEAELVKKLQGNEDSATIVRWICEKVLQSYKNGITAGQKGAKVIRPGDSRRRGVPSQAL